MVIMNSYLVLSDRWFHPTLLPYTLRERYTGTYANVNVGIGTRTHRSLGPWTRGALPVVPGPRRVVGVIYLKCIVPSCHIIYVYGEMFLPKDFQILRTAPGFQAI